MQSNKKMAFGESLKAIIIFRVTQSAFLLWKLNQQTVSQCAGMALQGHQWRTDQHRIAWRQPLQSANKGMTEDRGRRGGRATKPGILWIFTTAAWKGSRGNPN